MQRSPRSANWFVSSTALGFYTLAALLALAVALLFVVRGDLDLVSAEEAALQASVDGHVAAKESAEAESAALRVSDAAMQGQVAAAQQAQSTAQQLQQQQARALSAAEALRDEVQRALEAQQGETNQALQSLLEAQGTVEELQAALQAARTAADQDRSARERAERDLASAQARFQRELAQEQASAQPLLNAVITGELTFALDPLPDYAAEGAARDVAQTSADFAAWNALGFTVREAADGELPDLRVSWLRDAGEHPPMPAGDGRVWVSLGAANCNGRWAPYDGESVRRLLWHQLGHAVGYGHSDDAGNVMSETLQTRFTAEQSFSIVLAPFTSHTFPLCDAGTYTYRFDELEPLKVFRIGIIRPGIAPNDYFSADNHYQGCGAAPPLYVNQCIVDEGARLLVYSNVEIVRVNGEIIRDNPLPDVTMEWDPAAFAYDAATLSNLRALFP